MKRSILLLGLNYRKIFIEKNENLNEKVEIKPHINIISIEKANLDLIKEESVKISFLFGIEYVKWAELKLEGEIILKIDTKSYKELIKGWKDKKLDSELQGIILNIIMRKASIRAIELEEEMNLPIHINIPKLEISKRE